MAKKKRTTMAPPKKKVAPSKKKKPTSMSYMGPSWKEMSVTKKKK